MTTSTELLTDAFDRVKQVVRAAVEGLSGSQLSARPDPGANSIAWLVWHLTRVQDDHVAQVAGTEQVWTSQGWAGRFDLPFDAADTGFGHRAGQVAQVVADSPDMLTGYHDATHERTVRFLDRLTDDDLARIVDDAWDPPVTLAVRLVSVASDDLQHAGQASFIRGVLLRR